MADVTYDNYKVVFPDGLKKALARLEEATREHTEQALNAAANRVLARGMVRAACGEAVTHDEQEALRLAADPTSVWQLVKEAKGMINAGTSPQHVKRLLMNAGHSPDVASSIINAAREQRLVEKEALLAKNYGMRPEKLEALAKGRTWNEAMRKATYEQLEGFGYTTPKANVRFPIKEQPYPSDAAIVEEYSKFVRDLDQRKHALLDEGFYLGGHMITLEMAREAWSRELKRRLKESEDKRKLHAQKDYPEEWW